MPDSDETATFDNTSVNNCAANSATECYGIDIKATYSGTITQGANDISIGAGGYSQAGGVLVGGGGSSYWIYNIDDFIHSGGTIAPSILNLLMSGTGKILSLADAINFNQLSITGTVATGGDGNPRIAYANAGIGLSVSGIFTLNTAMLCFHVENLNLTGILDGGAGLFFQVYTNAPFANTGEIYCPIAFNLPGDAASRTVTLIGNGILGSTLLVDSGHASNTMTLDLNGHSLGATSITAGTRGIITDSVGGGTITGPVIVNGTGAVLTQGTGVPLNIDGALTLTSGTVTQLGPINVTGLLSIDGGVWTGDGIYDVMYSGLLAVSVITPTATKFVSRTNHQIDLYGDTTQSSLSVKSCYKDNVNLVAGTHTCDVLFHCDNLTIASGATFVQSVDVPIVVCRKTTNNGTYTQNTPSKIISGVRYFRRNLPINFPCNVATVK